MAASHLLPPPNPRKWRYTYEALSHIPTLRLLVFHPEIDTSSFHGLAASPRLELSLLLVTWSQSNGEQSCEIELKIPVPRVLIDAGAPVQCAAREDHIEVKFALVVPVDHEIAISFRDALLMDCGEREGEVDCSLPLALNYDFKSFSGEELHFYCNICSTRLTRKCLRNFVEMPSANWREVADNWFGTCCCSFGAASEQLVAKYVDRYTCSSGTCLLDKASIVLCKDDLESYMGAVDSNQNLHNMEHHLSGSKDQKNIVEEYIGCDTEVLHGDHICRGIDDYHGISGLEQHRKVALTEKTKEQLAKHAENFLSGAVVRLCATDDNVVLKQATHSLNLDYGEISNPDKYAREGNSLIDYTIGVNKHSRNLDRSFPDSHCCTVPANSISSLGTSERLANIIKPKYEHTKTSIWHSLSVNGSFGDGFLIRHSNISKDIKWVEFLCRGCSSLLGSYPSTCDIDSPVDEGIRLFKCSISTSTHAGGPHDKFRSHTLEKVFSNLLLENAVDELSYRTVVKDIFSKSPKLKLILLNSSAWCFTGHCFENSAVKPTFGIDLQPFAKVLYADCSSASENNLRELEDWSTKGHADEVFMLPHQIKKLTEVLNSWQGTFPSSCSSLLGMALSLLHR